MTKAFYSDTIGKFLSSSREEIVGELALNNDFALEQSQRGAWVQQINILQETLTGYEGLVLFEYSIPRMGQRIDVVLLIDAVIFVLEFKVGETVFAAHAVDQVLDYALDLKNFHESSHEHFVAPILIATEAEADIPLIDFTPQKDKLLLPIKTNAEKLSKVIEAVLLFSKGDSIDQREWKEGRYCPTPTIVEAAMALYGGHSVAEISRSDAGAINLSQTSSVVSEIIRVSKKDSQKAICFVTGVPGSGKTLVGLDIATSHIDKTNDLYSVFLSGNGPLVDVLREALARDKVRRAKAREQRRVRKGEAMSEVKMFIQNVHHFRDDCLNNPTKPPIEHVALFDEAQRAWNMAQTSNFMRRKKGRSDFEQSEPEFLISCLDRHPDWAVVVCLVGGGQEINTGEAGISEWIDSLQRSFPEWRVYMSPELTDTEYGAGAILEEIKSRPRVTYKKELHLSVSMRSFRAEHVSHFVKEVLDLDVYSARKTLAKLDKYPIVLTRNLASAKKWLKQQARGSERYGLLVSSQAERLKPYAVDVKSPIDPIHWFLDGKEDVRSSYYLEDVATEFHVQGLELDWACVMWDADFRYSSAGWEHWSFCGDRWRHIHKEERKKYLKNAYRVLLTRARQGMVIVVPDGSIEDRTRNSIFYDPTFQYLIDIGVSKIT